MKQIRKRLLSFLLSLVFLCGLLPRLYVFSAGYADGYAGGRSGDDCGILAKGIDISTWQGSNVDFNKIREQGYSFVILRAGFATTMDNTFENNYAKAKAAGLNIGVYLYSYAENAQDAKSEAAALCKWLSGKQLEYPVYYDLEEPELHGLMPKEQLTEIAMTFLDAMAADGWLVGLYSCRSWLESKLETDKICARYECWLAQYLLSGSCDTYDDFDGICGMWQYSSSGSVDGISGSADMDVCFKDYPTICKRYGFNGYTATGATLILTGAAAPSVLKYGTDMTISGKITSSAGNLANVTVGFFDEEGNQVQGRSAGPKTAAYDISALADGVKTKKLPEGSYYYRILATNSFETQTLLNQSVVVSESGIRTDHVGVPKDLREGDTFHTTGILTGVSAIKTVTVSVLNGDETVLNVTASPDAVTFDLAAFAEKLKFEVLTAGKYHYSVSAALSGGSSNRIVFEEFTVWVKDDPITVSDLSLKETYFIGDTITISGTVSSAKSEMQTCTAEILDYKENSLELTSALPGKTVSLEELCSDFKLDALSAGTYTFVIKAQNAGGPQEVLHQKFIIRPDAVSLCGCNAPTTLEKGETFLLQGVIASDDTPLEFVSVSITDINGKPHLSAGDVPQGNVYDLSDLNDTLLFSGLMLNDYTLRICARNGHGFYTLYEAKLTVSEASDGIYWENKPDDFNGITVYPGSGLSLDGMLISDSSEITEVSAEIFSEGNEQPAAAAFLYPDELTVSLSEMNEILRISALEAGQYRFVITAENANGSITLTDSAFSVSECPHEHIASGKKYEATCICGGAVCDDGCLDCGAKVRSGQRIDKTEHSYRDGACTECGRKEFITVFARQTQQIPEQSARIVIAAFDGKQWYALGNDGKAVKINTPDETDAISVTADLLWAPEYQRDGTVILRNPFGRLLHFDSGGLHIGRGMTNTGLNCSAFGQDMQIGLQGDFSRWLSFFDGAFIVSDTAVGVSVFLYIS